jgi:hypothetical protein
VDAGGDHTCAVTTDERAYCWGDGRLGQIGNGKAYLSFWPRAVAGGHSSRRGAPPPRGRVPGSDSPSEAGISRPAFQRSQGHEPSSFAQIT